jgi:hypothetical protein
MFWVPWGKVFLEKPVRPIIHVVNIFPVVYDPNCTVSTIGMLFLWYFASLRFLHVFVCGLYLMYFLLRFCALSVIGVTSVVPSR